MKEFIERKPIEKPEEEPKKPSVLEEEDFQEFIEDRNIAPEDLKIIEKLSQYPKDFFIEYHNVFNLNRERSEDELKGEIKILERDIGKIQDEKEKSLLEKKKEFAESFLEFTKKYDWSTSYHLNRVFERRDKEKFKRELDK